MQLLLAQSVETAEKGLTILQKIQAGGVPLICLIVAVVCGGAFYWQLKRNNKQAEDALAEAKAREVAANAVTDQRLKDQETLLREMLDRDREAQEAQLAAVQAVEGVTQALKESQKACDSTNQRVEVMDRRLEEFLRRLDTIEALLRRQPRGDA